MAKSDEIVKRLGQLRPEDFVHWLFPQLHFDKVSFKDREFLLSRRHVDNLFLVKTKELGEFYLHLEFQSKLKPKEDFGMRMLEYSTLIWKTLKKPVKSVAIFLNSTPKIRELEPRKICKIGEETFLDFRYQKIIFPKNSWKDILNFGFPTLLPLIPFSRIPKEEAEMALEQTFKKIEKIKDINLKRELVTYFYILGGYEYKEILTKIIGEKRMKDLMESATYRELAEQIEENTGKKLVKEFLTARFGKPSRKIESLLNKIKDFEDFKILSREAGIAKSLAEFEKVLEEMVKKQKK